MTLGLVSFGLGLWLIAFAPEDNASKQKIHTQFLYFENAQGKQSQRFDVEFARSPEERQRGLMFRQSLPSNYGMFFIFPVEEQRSFWMKNTEIPLDLIFIDSKLIVVNVVHAAEPFSTTSRESTGPAKFVFEVLGGIAEREGIDSGSKLQLAGELPWAY
ncbi:DUF192 domain-containing protein [bacterium]|nr:DUF192 domain-containing protein [bacterium]